MMAPSMKARTGLALWFAEWVATFGLIVTILAGIRFARSSVPWVVGLYIAAAYWFTASTSFANPAAAIARSLTDTFSGIRPIDVPLINRPIVVTPKGVKLCRPSETVLDILPNPDIGPFVKEDDDVVAPRRGQS
jgi:hypothetical protein